MFQPQTTSTTTTPSLFINDLTSDCTEANLFEIFSKIGPVASVKLCRDNVTRRSLGNGYVNYHSLNDAERALDALNFSLICGKPVRIMWSQRDPTLRKSGVGNIFVKNLDESIDNKLLYDTFSTFGNILSVKVPTNAEGKSNGYGFVQFTTEEAARNAIEKTNNKELENKILSVEFYKSKSDRSSGVNKEQFSNVYVKNLPDAFTQENLDELFSKFGKITSSYLKTGEDGKSKCFGFIGYASHEEAQAAVEALNDTLIQDKKVYVGRAQKKTERLQSLKQNWDKLKETHAQATTGANLYIKNLAEEVTEEMLRTDFGKFGAITSCKIMNDTSSARSRGFGFVAYASSDDATKALTNMNKLLYYNKPLVVCIAEPKEVRHQRLAQQFENLAKMPTPMYNGYPMQYPGPMFNGQVPVNRMPPVDMYGQQMMRGAGQMNRNYMPQGPYMGQANRGGAPYMMGQQQVPRQFNNRGGRGGAPGNFQQRPPQGQPMGVAGARGGRGGVQMGANRYTSTARNVPQEASLEQVLMSHPPEMQKQMLGERIFPLIQQRQPNLAGKITGMLLEMDNSELIALIENSSILDERVKEALEVLHQSESQVQA